MEATEQIRSRLTIDEVVGQYVQMKKSGRNFKALCPFHSEKSPSFIISPDKGLAYCFGCRKGGDIFAFVQEIEQVDFPQALKILADKAGVDLPERSYNPAKKEVKNRLEELMKQTQRFFCDQLKQEPSAQRYLSKRGYDASLQQQLGLGFAPDSFHQLTKHLEKAGFTPQEMLAAGVASQKEVGDSNVYDRFRNRVMFPILSPQGKLVAFGGRTLSKDSDAAKYLNSPESELYHKGQTLYGFYQAKQAIRDGDQAIVVEGYFDALTAHQKGFPQVVASLGTALTEQQLKLIGRFTKRVLFAFDADQSGQTAASRSIEIAQRLGYSVSVILIPSGKDPDEALRTHPEEWQKAVDGALKAIDYEFQKAFEQYDKHTIDGKKALAEHLLPIIHRFPSQIEQEHYLKQLAMELQTSLKSLLAEFQKHAPRQQRAPVETAAPPLPEAPQALSYNRAQHLLGLLLHSPDLIEVVQEQLKAEYILSEAEKKLYKELFAQYNHADGKGACMASDKQDDSTLQLLELYAEEKYEEFGREDLAQEAQRLCQSIRKEYRKHRLQSLRFQLAQAAQDPTLDSNQLMHEYQQVLSNTF